MPITPPAMTKAELLIALMSGPTIAAVELLSQVIWETSVFVCPCRLKEINKLKPNTDKV